MMRFCRRSRSGRTEVHRVVGADLDPAPRDEGGHRARANRHRDLRVDVDEGVGAIDFVRDCVAAGGTADVAPGHLETDQVGVDGHRRRAERAQGSDRGIDRVRGRPGARADCPPMVTLPPLKTASRRAGRLDRAGDRSARRVEVDLRFARDVTVDDQRCAAPSAWNPMPQMEPPGHTPPLSLRAWIAAPPPPMPFRCPVALPVTVFPLSPKTPPMNVGYVRLTLTV